MTRNDHADLLSVGLHPETMCPGPDPADHLLDRPDRSLNLQSVDMAVGILRIGTDRSDLILTQSFDPCVVVS